MGNETIIAQYKTENAIKAELLESKFNASFAAAVLKQIEYGRTSYDEIAEKLNTTLKEVKGMLHKLIEGETLDNQTMFQFMAAAKLHASVFENHD